MRLLVKERGPQTKLDFQMLRAVTPSSQCLRGNHFYSNSLETFFPQSSTRAHCTKLKGFKNPPSLCLSRKWKSEHRAMTSASPHLTHLQKGGCHLKSLLCPRCLHAPTKTTPAGPVLLLLPIYFLSTHTEGSRALLYNLRYQLANLISLPASFK